MSRHAALTIALMVLLDGALATAREQAAPIPGGLAVEAGASRPAELIIGGAVRRVIGPGVFILEDRHAADDELMVIAPDAEATPVPGARVVARGVFRRFAETELEKLRHWNEMDAETRSRFASRSILLATSLATASGRSLMASPSPVVRPFAQPAPVVAPRRRTEINLHPAGLAELINEVGGRRVTLPKARVISVLNSRVFLIESTGPLPAVVGNLDRVLVLIEDAGLRVDAASLTGADVRVVGVARTLLGLQVTGDAAWPRELTPEMVRRLEIRAAVLATSVQTADGVELTNRPSTPLD
jgi:hypothetical protein